MSAYFSILIYLFAVLGLVIIALFFLYSIFSINHDDFINERLIAENERLEKELEKHCPITHGRKLKDEKIN